MSWFSYLTFGYFGSSEINQLGRNLPPDISVSSLCTYKSSNEQKFVTTTAEQLQEVRKNLRKVTSYTLPTHKNSKGRHLLENLMNELINKTKLIE